MTEEMRLRTLEKRLLDSDEGAGLLLIEAADDSEDDPTEKRLDRRLVAFFFSPSMVTAGASATVIGGTESRGEEQEAEWSRVEKVLCVEQHGGQ